MKNLVFMVGVLASAVLIAKVFKGGVGNGLSTNSKRVGEEFTKATKRGYFGRNASDLDGLLSRNEGGVNGGGFVGESQRSENGFAEPGIGVVFNEGGHGPGNGLMSDGGNGSHG
jgi:hypothetical protein